MNVILNKKRGFTLIELTLVMAVISLISFLAFKSMSKEFEERQAEANGKQIKDVGMAVNNYIVNHYDVISKLQNASGGTLDIGPRTCNANKNICMITTETLSKEGLLPPTFNGKNTYGSGYNIVIKRGGASPYWNITGLIMTDTPLMLGSRNGNPRFDLLGLAMQTAGPDSGMTKSSSSKVDGYKGTWSANSSDYENINRLGLLGYIAGYGSNSYSAFLRRDGTLPMTGDLNMGTKNIYGAVNITASGKGTFGGEVQAGSWVHAKNGYGDLVSFGGDASANDYEIRMDADKPLSIHMKSNRNDITALKVTGGVGVTGVLDTTGNITSGGNITAGNWLIAHNGGGNTMYIGGDAAPHANGSLANDYEIRMDTAKPLTIWNTAMSGDRKQTLLEVWGSQKIAGNLSVSAANTADGSITASGNIQSSQTVSGAYLLPTSTVVEGTACVDNGKISKNANGALLSCQNKVWKNAFNKDKGYFSRTLTGTGTIVSFEDYFCSVNGWLKWKNTRTGSYSLYVENGMWKYWNNGEWLKVDCFKW